MIWISTTHPFYRCAFFRIYKDISYPIPQIRTQFGHASNKSSHLQARWDLAKSLPGTQQVQFIKPVNNYQLGHGKNSTFINRDEALSIATLMPIIEVAEVVPTTSPKVGDFVLVTCPTQHKRNLSYVGQLIGAQANKFEVKFLRARDAEKKAFVFPTMPDTDIISTQIMEKLVVPTISNSSIHVFKNLLTVHK